MDIDARVEAWASLQLIPGLSSRAGRLAQGVRRPRGSAGGIAGKPQTIGQRRARLGDRAGRRSGRAQPLARLARRAPAMALVAWGDPAYPSRIASRNRRSTAGAPLSRAERRLRRTAPALAIVGSRNATPQGRARTPRRSPPRCPPPASTIVSGLAHGIDAAAHRGGLAGAGSSVAVVGNRNQTASIPPRTIARSRIDLAIDARTRALRNSRSGTPPLERETFPRRNRARQRARRAASSSSRPRRTVGLAHHRAPRRRAGTRSLRDCPGSIHSPFSKGGHRLITRGRQARRDCPGRAGGARPGAGSGSGQAGRRHARRQPTATPARVLAALGHDPVDVDTLAAAHRACRQRDRGRAGGARARAATSRRCPEEHSSALCDT